MLKIPGLPWLLAGGVALCVAYFAIWYGGLNQDEGWYLYSAQMVRAGRLPYRDFFFTQSFKRNCAPDGVPVFSVYLAPSAWHVPSDISGAAFR